MQYDLPVGFLYDRWTQRGGKCFYTDIEMTMTGRAPTTISVDKVLPEDGYTIGNTVLCANRINSMKQDATLAEMREWMPMWAARAEAFLGNF